MQGATKKISVKQQSKGAYYIQAIKKNQKTFHEEISGFFTTTYQYDFKNIAP